MTFDAAADWLIWSGWFWLGWGYQRWSARRNHRASEPDIHPSWIKMATELVEHMRWVRDTHRFAGDDVEARWDSVYTVKGLGRFAVSIKRADKADA